MKRTSKILLTDINADRDRENSLIKYQKLMAAAFTNYATIKLSLNLFTMYEMSEEISLDRRDEIEGYIDTVDAAIRSVYIDKESVESENYKACLDEVIKARDSITRKMKILTAYTDAFEIYEYIINRREPEVLGTIDESIDVSALANSMYEFVFSENDKMLVNTRIQEFIAQLPVRMTKSRFMDIISNSLAIYRGGEKKSVDEFVQMLRDAMLMDIPDGFNDEYPRLYEIYKTFKDTDYKVLDRAGYDKLSDMLTEGTELIQSAVTDYLMLTEIINDILIILYTNGIADKSFIVKTTDKAEIDIRTVDTSKLTKYEISSLILTELVKADDIYEASKRFDEYFVQLEGAQEDAYEELLGIEVNLDDLNGTYYEMYGDDIKNAFDCLTKADILTSSSLFMDIDKSSESGDSIVSVVSDEADDIYILETKNSLEEDIDELFKTFSKQEKRSVMAKVLSLMPVFFNSQQEILEYFEYALNSCSDKAELTACRDIVNDLMM
ncbi:MAG: hypothetical protein J6M65_02445 [Eubacterium sp.]|nr:hypothetical protein [Eubacterium sp.]